MKKKVIIAVAIFLILALSVGGALIYDHFQNENEVQKEVVVSSRLPQLQVYYGKDQVGVVDGYTMSMEDSLIRDVIVPVTPDRQVSFALNTNANEILEIYYEIADIKDVSSIDAGNLIDAGEITDYTENDGRISFSYKASTILESNKEYYLRIIVKTDAFEQVNYYARMMVLEDEFVTEQVAFALEFSNKTFDDENANKLALYLETENNKTHDNLGQVTINTNYSMLVWGTLVPEKITDTNITLKEICIKDSGQAATYTMNYQIKAENAEKITETYNVAETITVWSCAGQLYVLAYDREVNQIWEATASTVGNSFIDLGIQNQTSIDFVESEDGQYLSFAINGSVYLMDTDGKQIKPLYRLVANDADALTKTKARAVSVDDEGNAGYIIYGYSQAEEHIGKNGISVMAYDSKSKTSTEVAFIPCEMPAEMLEEQLGELCYIGDGTLYMTLDSTVYYANLNTKEWGALVKNMEDGSYAVNSDGNLLAYNTNGSTWGATSITVVNLATGEKKVIESEAERISVCGYTASNLIYGEAEYREEELSFLPINKLIILDEELNEIKTYQQKNVLIKKVEITDNIINIKRWKKGKDIADDQLLDNTEAKASIAKSSYYLDDVKQRELALSFNYNLDASINLGIASEAKNIFSKNTELAAEFATGNVEKYYVYGYGKYQGVYLNKKDAIAAAREVYGLIVDDSGQKIWTLEENYE